MKIIIKVKEDDHTFNCPNCNFLNHSESINYDNPICIKCEILFTLKINSDANN